MIYYALLLVVTAIQKQIIPLRLKMTYNLSGMSDLKQRCPDETLIPVQAVQL